MTALGFIVGTGRCGSTLLSTMLECCPDITSVSEFFASTGAERAFGEPSIDGSSLWRLFSEHTADAAELLDAVQIPEIVAARSARVSAMPPLMLATLPRLVDDSQATHDALRSHVEALPRSPPGHQFSSVFAWLGQRFQRPIVVERSGGSLGYAEALTRLFPDARFVHLWRDGAECAYSMSRHPYFRVVVTRVCGSRRAAKPSITECLSTVLPIDRYGVFWSATVLRGLGALRTLPAERVLHISFNQLINQPLSTLSSVARFFGGSPDHPWMGRACAQVKQTPPHMLSAPADVRRALERACQPGMRALLDLGTAQPQTSSRAGG
jgi:hypothetical protein